MKVDQSSAGRQLTKHEIRNVHALSVSCPRPGCGAGPGERCRGARSHPDGYPNTLHVSRERELRRRLDEATAALSEDRAKAVRVLFMGPLTKEQRRAVANVLLRPEQRLPPVI